MLASEGFEALGRDPERPAWMPAFFLADRAGRREVLGIMRDAPEALRACDPVIMLNSIATGSCGRLQPLSAKVPVQQKALSSDAVNRSCSLACDRSSSGCNNRGSLAEDACGSRVGKHWVAG